MWKYVPKPQNGLQPNEVTRVPYGCSIEAEGGDFEVRATTLPGAPFLARFVRQKWGFDFIV